jgi:hypothetical protein
MPKWVQKVLFVLLVIGALIGLLYYLEYTKSLDKSLPISSEGSLSATAIAQFTPTWGPDDIDNLVATAIPTPYAKLTIPEVEAMNKALQDKKILLATDYLYGAEYKALGVSWYCDKISLGKIDLPFSNIGGAKLVEGKWSMGVSLSDITFTMEEGSKTTPVYYDGDGAPYTEQKYNGVLVITINKIGVDGPVYLSNNEWLFSVGDPIPGYELWLIPRQIITGVSLVEEKRLYVLNMAQKRVKLETIAPDGSNEILLAMYDKFESSFSEPGQGHIYDTAIAIFEPMAKEKGYASIESVKVVMPEPPRSIYGWTDMNGMQFIPFSYPSLFEDSTCPQPKPSAADIDWMMQNINKE